MPRTLVVVAFAIGLCVAASGPDLRAEEEEPTVLGTPDAVRKALSHRDASVRLAAARAAEAMQDTKLTTPLVKLLKDKETAVRLAAVEALTARAEPKARKAAAVGLAARLAPLSKTEAEQGEMLVVVKALHDLGQPATIKTLLDVTVNDPPDVVKARAMAVANVPTADAIEGLIALGSKGRRKVGWHGIVRAALNYATGAKFTGDPDMWRQWWRDNEDSFSFQAAAERREAQRQARADKQRRQEEAARRREEKRRNRGERKDRGDT